MTLEEFKMALLLLGFVEVPKMVECYYKYKGIRINIDTHRTGLFDNPKVYFRVLGDQNSSNTLHTLKYALQHITEEMDYLYDT